MALKLPGIINPLFEHSKEVGDGFENKKNPQEAQRLKKIVFAGNLGTATTASDIEACFNGVSVVGLGDGLKVAIPIPYKGVFKKYVFYVGTNSIAGGNNILMVTIDNAATSSGEGLVTITGGTTGIISGIANLDYNKGDFLCLGFMQDALGGSASEIGWYIEYEYLEEENI